MTGFEAALKGETAASAPAAAGAAQAGAGAPAGDGASAPLTIATTAEEAEMLKLLESLANPDASAFLTMDIPDVDPSRMASLEVELPDKPKKGEEENKK